MKLKELYLCCFICLFTLFLNRILIGSELETIIEGVKYNNSLIQSGKGELTIERSYTSFGKQQITDQTGHMPQDGKNQVFYAFKKSKSRCEQPHLIEVFDGEKYLVYRKGKDTRHSVGEIHGRNQMNILFDPRYWGIRYERKSIGEYLEAYAQKIVGREKVDEDIGQEKVGEYICTIIEAKTPNHSEGRVRFWVNIQKGYRISKTEWKNPFNKNVVIDRFFYKEYQKGVWFPQSGWYTISSPNKTTGKLDIVTKFSMKIKNFVVNMDIPDAMFRIDFPAGIRIIDYRTGAIRSPEELQ